jgi:hypothetical protein
MFCPCGLLIPGLTQRPACRWLWTGYHQIVGVVAILLAFINAILGMRNMSVYYGYFLGFTLIWLAIIVMWIIGRCIWTKRKKSMVSLLFTSLLVFTPSGLSNEHKRLREPTHVASPRQ